MIVARAGADTVDSFEGDDVICGGAGDDILTARSGQDRYRGGRGNDLISFRYELAAVQVVLPTKRDPGRASSAESSAEVDVLVGIESVEATDYDDQIQGSEMNNRLFGGDGDDVILAEGGDDEVDGGGGRDTIDGGAHPDGLEGGPGDDEITGGGSRKRFYLTSDVLSGGAGNDILRGEAGSDDLVGGPGDDELNGGASPSGIFYGDSVSYATSPSRVTANLSTELATGEGSDILIDIEDLEGSTFDDVLTGNAKGNLFEAGLGDDELFGGYGIDFLFPGEGRNVIDGGQGGESASEGDFVMYVFHSSGVQISSEPSEEAEQITNVELIFGSHFDDVIAGGPDADRIFAWGGNDYINGGSGDDYLDPGRGDDEVDGGDGTDTCAESAERMMNCELSAQSADQDS